MKRILFLSWVLSGLIFTSAFSQNESNYKSYIGVDNIKLGAQVHHSHYIESYNTTAVGLIIEASGQRIGVSYAGRIGYSSNGQFYAYTGVGQVAGFYLIKHGASALDLISLIGILLPETFLVYSYPSPKTRLAFYLSPWGVEQRGTSLPEAETKVSVEAGVKFSVKIKNVYLEPFAGAKAIYKTERQGFTVGLNFHFIK